MKDARIDERDYRARQLASKVQELSDIVEGLLEILEEKDARIAALRMKIYELNGR